MGICHGGGSWRRKGEGGRRENISFGDSASLSKRDYFPHSLSLLTSTGTLGPNWMWTLSKGIWAKGRHLQFCSYCARRWSHFCECGRVAGGQTPVQMGTSHTVCIMTNYKNSHNASVVTRPVSLEPSLSISISLTSTAYSGLLCLSISTVLMQEKRGGWATTARN